ncbi:hypothetical protein JNUCC1_01948 [Lentibacillus sp. JNUCC-1]|uniref:ABC transporter permease n=1 Tax=Lentibacillus sp. JNUCC-1 TaxID=2654513 RepID=UPI0012E6F226|nr:ABC transporter permease [Lentibacillus sp. JNUCC-1]MUV38124.1 hypothetical protein [Lentibacillus sp. JNUCC-1]
MSFSWKRMSAILVKDYKDVSRNMAVFSVLILMPVLSAFYGRMGIDGLGTIYMLINVGFVMVASFLQSCLIAEEKDKNTLRGLMLSPASIAEVLLGKSLLSFIATAIIIFVSLFFVEYVPGNIGIVTAALALSCIFYICLGTLLGLYAKSVMDASVLVMPIFFVFSIGTLAKGFMDQYSILKVLNILPNFQLLELAEKVEQQAGVGAVMGHMGVILAWVVLSCILTVVVYKKRMVD